MSKIVVIAKVVVKEEFLEEVQQELIKLHKSTHENDEGCIQYDLHKSSLEKNSFTFVETWENEEVLNEHQKKEHFISCIGSIEKKIESLQIDKLTKLDI